MTQALALITGDINDTKDAFMSVLADRSMSFEREAGFALQVLGSNSYALGVASQNRQSVVNAVKNIAAIGISLNPAKKQAYLVPRGGAICLDISYMGLMDLAMATGSIKWAQAELVRENDGFARGSFDKPPDHVFNPFSKNRGEIIGVYVVVKTADGDYLTHTMEIGEVYDIRDRSEAWKKKSGPWKTDPGEMIKKTCVKQAYKYWPKTDRLETAIHHLNTDGGEGMRDIGEPERGSDWIDVAQMIARAYCTASDSDALKFWKENNALLINQPVDHKRLKDAISRHRAALCEKDVARTIDMPATQPAAPVQPPASAMTDDEADYARSAA